jgi:hypothetical protein
MISRANSTPRGWKPKARLGARTHSSTWKAMESPSGQPRLAFLQADPQRRPLEFPRLLLEKRLHISILHRSTTSRSSTRNLMISSAFQIRLWHAALPPWPGAWQPWPACQGRERNQAPPSGMYRYLRRGKYDVPCVALWPVWLHLCPTAARTTSRPPLQPRL